MGNRCKLHAILFCVFLAVGVTASSLYSQTLKIYHIDVEQADATLFVSPDGQTMHENLTGKIV